MILVTGVTGFVSSALVARLARDGIETHSCVRRNDVTAPDGVHTMQVGDLNADTDWSRTFTGVSVVVHATARAHLMDDTATGPLTELRRINVQGTLRLARQAAATGVRRFVFISYIKVNGEATYVPYPRPLPRGEREKFNEDDTPAPLDPYGVTKTEAEQGLHQIAAETGMEVVIIRPPLVYGHVVKANFAALMRAVQRGLPLPRGAVHNRRSLVALDNLVDFTAACVSHPQAANQTFLVVDGHDLSTTELVRGLARATGVPARLLPVASLGPASGGLPC